MWHVYLEYMSEKRLLKLHKCQLLKEKNICIVSYTFVSTKLFKKHYKLSYNTFVYQTEGILNYIHLDVW